MTKEETSATMAALRQARGLAANDTEHLKLRLAETLPFEDGERERWVLLDGKEPTLDVLFFEDHIIRIKTAAGRVVADTDNAEAKTPILLIEPTDAPEEKQRRATQNCAAATEHQDALARRYWCAYADSLKHATPQELKPGPAFQKTRWGMRRADLLELYPGARENEDGSVSTPYIPLLDSPFVARFIFDSSGGLIRTELVRVEQDGVAEPGRDKRLVSVLLTGLEEKLGKPTESQNRSGLGAFARWMKPDAVVRFFYDPVTAGSHVWMIYQTRADYDRQERERIQEEEAAKKAL